jgi:hypothetical protein
MLFLQIDILHTPLTTNRFQSNLLPPPFPTPKIETMLKVEDTSTLVVPKNHFGKQGCYFMSLQA